MATFENMALFNSLRNRVQAALRNWFSTGFEAQELKHYRQWDRRSFREGTLHSGNRTFWWTEMGLTQSRRRFGVDYVKVARQLLRKKERLRFLDLGAGQGIIGVELQNAVGLPRVEAHAVSLLRPYRFEDGKWEVTGAALRKLVKKPWERFKTFHVGDFRKHLNNWYGHDLFDLIVSHSSTSIAPLHAMAIAGKLSPGGEAYLHMDLGGPGVFDRLKSHLETHMGIEAEIQWRDSSRRTVFVKMKRRE